MAAAIHRFFCLYAGSRASPGRIALGRTGLASTVFSGNAAAPSHYGNSLHLGTAASISWGSAQYTGPRLPVSTAGRSFERAELGQIFPLFPEHRTHRPAG